MRIAPFLISGLCTAGLILVLNTQLTVGGSKTPRLGYFLSPQLGFWQNAESTNTDFSGELKLNGLKGKVDVFMDDRLVPHIYADNDLDAYYVQGFMQSSLVADGISTHVAAGRLSEILGEESYLPIAFPKVRYGIWGRTNHGQYG